VTSYHIPKNTQKADEIYAVLSRDNDGNEGIAAAITSLGAMPMVFHHKEILDKLMPIIKKTAKETNRKLHIVKYTQREEIEIIEP